VDNVRKGVLKAIGLAVIILCSMSIEATDVSAQAVSPRLGVGLNAMGSTADGFGLGIRGRASAPINADVSFALDLGFTGFILGGRRDASYVFDPQASFIVSIPDSGDRLSYLLFGAGAYVPLGDADSRSGPTIHAGYGRVHILQETSLYWEINPAVMIGDTRVDLIVPLRVGVIF
jgi:hypothetical protein